MADRSFPNICGTGAKAHTEAHISYVFVKICKGKFDLRTLKVFNVLSKNVATWAYGLCPSLIFFDFVPLRVTNIICP
jgi:hypothetical protein